MSGVKYSANPKITSSKLGDEMALMDIVGGTYFALNSVGASIWMALDKPCTKDELVARITSQFEVSESVCRPDIAALLEELKGKGLVEESH